MWKGTELKIFGWLTDSSSSPPSTLPTRNLVQRTGLWWIRSSCFKLLKAGKSSSKFCFVQVYIHQADTGVLGHLRYCHTWFSSSLGYLIPNLKGGVTDTEYMQQPNCEVVLNPDLSCVISTDDILLVNKPIWFWNTPRQVDLLLMTLRCSRGFLLYCREWVNNLRF